MITDLVLIAAAVLFLGVYVSWRAGRLDRMHTRLEAARAALDVTLVRRSSVALELASSGVLDPATSLLLAGAAHDARGGNGDPDESPGDPVPAPAGGTAGGANGGTAGGTDGGTNGGAAGRAGAPSGGPALARPASGDELTRSELAQSDLSRALRAAFAQPGFRASLTGKDGADELLAEVEAAAHQVFVARKFYNNAVAATREARRKPLVRLLRLAGNAGLPEFFEMDDSLVAADGDGAGADMQRLAQ